MKKSESYYSKLLLIVFFTLGLSFLPIGLKAQTDDSLFDIEIKFNVEKQTLHSIFKSIENLTDYNFSYNSSRIDLEKSVLVNTTTSIGDCLKMLENQFGLRFKQSKLLIHVYPQQAVNEVAPKEKKKIQGVVEDSQGSVLIGATVRIKGTTDGTITDYDGLFTMEVEEGTTLLVSYIGYNELELVVDSKNDYQVILSSNFFSLEEVVVVGYGVQRKSDLTGSISSIKGAALERQPVASIDEGLQGLAAGVQLQQTSGAPGAAMSLKVRGSNSISASSQPLFVIDGLPILPSQSGTAGSPSLTGVGNNTSVTSNPLNTISPNDIQSVEILKDASAVALYGSRASNGVVLITTKRGSSGESRISLNSYYGIQNISNTVDFMNAEQHLDYLLRAKDQGATLPDLPEQPINETDWIEETVEENAIMQSHTLSLSGGKELVKYATSFNYFKQDGIVQNSGLERGSLRINLDVEAKKWLNVGLNLNSSISSNDVQISGGGGNYRIWNSPFTWSQWLSPLMGIEDSEGGFNQIYDIAGDRVMNPLGATASNVTNNLKTNRTFGTIFAEITPFKSFKYRINLGGDLSSSKRNVFYPLNHPFGAFETNNRGFVSTSTLSNWLIENLFYYDLEKGSHRINILAGVTAQEERVERLTFAAEDFTIDGLGYNALQLGAIPDSRNYGTSAVGWTLLSGLSRINYVLNDKYLFTFSFRADGSSKFGENNRFGYFPSFALGWNLGDEDFLKTKSDFLDNLKLRASWGVSGNQEIPANLQYVTFEESIMPPLVDDNDNEGVVGFRRNGLANPDLKWERTTQFNAGLDFGVYKNRLSGSLDYYYKSTSDLLLLADLPGSSFSAFQNIGRVINEGFELSLSGILVDRKNFDYRLTANISRNVNMVKSLGSDEERIFINLSPLTGSILTAYVLEEGAPMGSIYGYIFDGIHQEDILLEGPNGDGSDNQFFRAGDIKYRDLNRDGIITARDDQQIIGDPNPDFVFGLSQSFEFGNFDLNIFLNGEFGKEVLNYNRTFWETGQVAYKRTTVASNFWTQENTNTTIPRIGFNGNSQGSEQISTRIIEDGSFMRVRNITVGYTTGFGESGINARFYASGQNLFLLTNYSGFDPEANYSSGSNTVQGLDFGAYPLSKTFTVGIQVNL